MFDLTRRGLLAAGAMAVLSLAACSSGEKPEDKAVVDASASADAGPAYALLTVPAGKAPPADLAAQLSAAKQGGDIADALLVSSKPSVEGPVGFAQLAVVEFPTEAAFENWSQASAPKLGENVIVRRADLIVDDRAKTHGAKPAYVVSHYEALIPKDQYTTYTTSYIKPNMDGQKAGGVMAGYAMYYEREPVPGIKGSRTVLVKEYMDEAAFARSEGVKTKDKARLLKDPEWKRINDSKDSLRKDISGTLALPVNLP